MNRREALHLLDELVAELESRTYRDWQGLLGESVHLEKQGPSGVTYQMEYEAFWDDKAGGAIRVMVSIDDGSFIRATFPLGTSLLILENT